MSPKAGERPSTPSAPVVTTLKSKSPHYKRWASMLSRCRNKNAPNWKNYGGRGIRVCAEWERSENFVAWCEATYIPGTTLDRIDNDGDYSPRNCRWATVTEQHKTRRKHTAVQGKQYAKLGAARQEAWHKSFGDPRKRPGKVCPRCGLFLENSLFYRRRGKADGLSSACKACTYTPTGQRGSAC
jgi:hypothetical protein